MELHDSTYIEIAYIAGTDYDMRKVGEVKHTRVLKMTDFEEIAECMT